MKNFSRKRTKGAPVAAKYMRGYFSLLRDLEAEP